MLVDSPGFSSFFSSLAVTQPHETRMLEILTVYRVVFLTGKKCFWVGPRGTDPRSLGRTGKQHSGQRAPPRGAGNKEPRHENQAVPQHGANSCSLPPRWCYTPRGMEVFGQQVQYDRPLSSCQRGVVEMPPP